MKYDLTKALIIFICSNFVLHARTIGLKEAEHIAIKNSFELRILRAESDIHVENKKERLRDFFPSVSLSYRQNRTIARRDYDNGLYSVQINVSQPVYDGGRTMLAYEIAKIDQRLARENYKTSRNNIRFQVRQAFFAMQQSMANISVARESLKSTEYLFKKAMVERGQGAIAELDLREILNELERRKLQVKFELLAYHDQLTDFAIMLDLPEGEIPEITLIDLFRLNVRMISRTDSELYELALKNHQALRKSRMDLFRSRKEYLITKYDYLPSMALTGHYGKTGDEWPPRVSQWGVGFSFTFNFLGNTLQSSVNSNRSRNGTASGLSTDGQLNIYNNAAWRKPHLNNKIALARTRRKYRNIRRSIKLDVQRKRRDLIERKKELRLTDEQLAIQELRFKIEMLKYRNGAVSIQDLFEKEIKLIQKRLEIIKKRLEYALAVNKFEIDIGLDLDEFGLINYKDIEYRVQKKEIIRRAWKPRTKIKTPESGADKKSTGAKENQI